MLLHHSVFKRRMRGSLYEIGVFVSLCASVVTFYVGSFGDNIGLVGLPLALMYTVGSLVSIASFALIPWYIQCIGTRRLLLVASAAYLVGIYTTAFATSFLSLVIPFTLVSASFGIILSLLDLYVEYSTDSSHTEGDVRGLYLGLENFAYIAGPFLGGLVLTMGGYGALFIASSLFMVPVLGIVYEHLQPLTLPHTAHARHAGFSPAHVLAVWRMQTLRDTYLFYLILRIFFALFGIYMALFLHDVHGFSFAEIGALIAISLIPMVVVEVPVGHLLGTTLHHGAVGMAGFVVLAITSGFVPYIESSDFVVWALLLFTMRIGAALVEIVAETYFFSIAGSDTEKAALFRALYPVSFIVGPLFATLTMSLAGYSGLFFFLTLISLAGAYLASTFKDVR